MTEVVKVLFTQEDLEALKGVAKGKGLKLSPLLRMMALELIAQEPPRAQKGAA